MRRPLALLLAFLLLIALVWFVLPHESPAPVAQDPPAAKPAEPQAAALESAPVESEVGRVEAPEAPAAEVASPKLAILRGRLVFENGAPASGAGLALQGVAANSERLMKFGKPADWRNLDTRCDEDGRFELRFDPPRAFQFILEARNPGCVRASWRWSEIEPGTTKDLGETILPRGGAVAGRVLNAQGKPTGEAWSVYAEVRTITKGDGSNSSNVNAQADPATGEFRLEDLSPGFAQLNAYSPLASRVDGPKVEVRAGETVQADICYSGPDNSRRIVVATSTRPFFRFGSNVGEVRLSSPGKETRKGQKQGNSASSYSFDDLEPGAYTVEVEDPHFLPWRQDGVQPGQRVSAKLVGAASVSLAVVDTATRKPIEGWMLRVRFKDANHRPNEFDVVGRDAEPPKGGLVEGLIPVDQTLIVLAEGYAPGEVDVPDLKAGERRALTVELRRGTTLVARLVQSDGVTPVPGRKVTLAPDAPDPEQQRTVVFLQDDARQREAESGADGRASFPAVAAGSYTLRAELSPLLVAERKGCAIGPEATVQEFDLALPPSGRIRGRVLGLDPAVAAKCSLVLLPTALGRIEKLHLGARLRMGSTRNSFLLGADGSFAFGPLRAGNAAASLQFPEAQTGEGARHGWTSPGAEIPLGEVEIPDGGEVVREFDVRGKLPGKVEVDVRVNGAPAAYARVVVQPLGPARNDSQIELDAQGHGLSGAIAAGRVSFDVWAADDSWCHTPQGSWTVPSDDTLHVQWDILLAEGTLQLVEEGSGTPIAGKQVSLYPEDDSNGFVSGVNRTSDAEGKLEVRLAPGGYRVVPQFERGADGKVSPSPYKEAHVEWTERGPTQAVLKLAKKP